MKLITISKYLKVNNKNYSMAMIESQNKRLIIYKLIQRKANKELNNNRFNRKLPIRNVLLDFQLISLPVMLMSFL